MIITQHYINARLGDNLNINVNPSTIFYHVGSNRFLTKPYEKKLSRLPTPFRTFSLRFLRRIHPFIIPATLYPKPIHIQHHDKYSKIKEVMENRHQLQKTQWYQSLLHDLHSSGYARHRKIEMRSEEDIITFFNHHVFTLIDSMKTVGYCNKKNSDPGKAIIGPDGFLHKCSAGDHRFYVARFIGLQSIPLRIVGVHRKYFLSYKNSNGQTDFFDCLKMLLSDIEKKHK